LSQPTDALRHYNRKQETYVLYDGQNECNQLEHKPVVDVAGDAQCCAVADRWMDRWIKSV